MAQFVITGKDGDESLCLYAELHHLSYAVTPTVHIHGTGCKRFAEADAALGSATNDNRKSRGLPMESWL